MRRAPNGQESENDKIGRPFPNNHVGLIERRDIKPGFKHGANKKSSQFANDFREYRTAAAKTIVWRGGAWGTKTAQFPLAFDPYSARAKGRADGIAYGIICF